MNRRLVTPALLLLAAAAATAACGADSSTAAAQAPKAAAEVPFIDVAVVRATAGTLESALDISGTLAPRSRVGLKPKLPGRLERILVDIGDRVTRGQIVATIDRGEVDAQVDAAVAATGVAKAGIESAEAGLANALPRNG
jgi:cobalt-zinc-cadmium efflux system membrane fusion protein